MDLTETELLLAELPKGEKIAGTVHGDASTSKAECPPKGRSFLCDNEFHRIVPNDDQLFADLIHDQLNKPARSLPLQPWLIPSVPASQPFLCIHKPS
jgi:hypothetical protein